MTDTRILKLAALLDRKYRQDYAQYLEDCESYYRDGYRPRYCEHGTNQWTDWDNICGPCEDGLTMSDGVFRMGYAISVAKERAEKAAEIMAFYAKAKALRLDHCINDDAIISEYAKLWIV